MKLERAILEIIREERPATPLVKAALKLASALFETVVSWRNRAYEQGVLPSTELPACVVSIGNISVGGTGKTPVTAFLAQAIQDNHSLAILSRGYRSAIERKKQIKKISMGDGPLYSAEECGDEPYLLAQKTKASIWVGKDRVLSGWRAIDEGKKCLILDDGFQHRRLKRNIDIVVIDAQDPLGRGSFLPRGLLRDSPRRLREAHLIVANHLTKREEYDKLQSLLAPYTEAPIVGMQVQLNAEEIRGRKVALFCGIGNPERFKQALQQEGCTIVDALILPDHIKIEEKQLKRFIADAMKKGAECVVCTEKDFVKLDPALAITPVAMQLKVIAGKEHWDKLIENLEKGLRNER
jgi:tetraacyldisaccharide 4'-kinase